MWIFDYFKKEFNAQIYHQPMLRKINQKVFFIGHGDGLGPGDLKYKIIKKFFRSKVCQWTFARFHPNFGIGIANYFSRKSRATNGKNDEKFLGKENEWLYLYSKEIAKKEKIDYFVFGHRHLPIELPIDQSTYYNLGEWISYCTFAQFDGEDFHMKSWVDGKVQPFIFNENN
jgi:UDP-2,3-diacylglucosamine hydrolase